MKNYIAYYRVSTQKQGNSGLGLESQKRDVHQFISNENGNLINEITEVESGKKNNRKALNYAISKAKALNATLIIAKLDRLSRNVSFVSSLMEKQVDFIAVDMPEANNFTIHIFAALAEQERKFISERTNKGLQVAKSKGITLGTNNLTNEGRKKGVETNKQNSFEYYKPVIAYIRAIKKDNSIRTIVSMLNDNGFYTIKGKKFGVSQVQNLIKRNNL